MVTSTGRAGYSGDGIAHFRVFVRKLACVSRCAKHTGLPRSPLVIIALLGLVSVLVACEEAGHKRQPDEALFLQTEPTAVGCLPPAPDVSGWHDFRPLAPFGYVLQVGQLSRASGQQFDLELRQTEWRRSDLLAFIDSGWLDMPIPVSWLEVPADPWSLRVDQRVELHEITAVVRAFLSSRPRQNEVAVAMRGRAGQNFIWVRMRIGELITGSPPAGEQSHFAWYRRASFGRYSRILMVGHDVYGVPRVHASDLADSRGITYLMDLWDEFEGTVRERSPATLRPAIVLRMEEDRVLWAETVALVRVLMRTRAERVTLVADHMTLEFVAEP